MEFIKKVIGSVLCVVALTIGLGKIIGHKPDTAWHNAQDWALFGVLLTTGIALFHGKKKKKSE
ncbi:MAG: LPXTG cell wall anchor domain-containing protein [Lentisphaeria bacterium]